MLFYGEFFFGILVILFYEFQGRHHSGIDDVKSLVEIIRWILRRGHVIERYSDNLERTGRRERNRVAK